MAKDNDLFTLVAEKLAGVQKGLLTLLASALVFSAADLLAGRQAKSAFETELLRQQDYMQKAEAVTSRLRFLLSHLYPERALSERQRLTLLIQDVRRVRRLFESTDGVDAALLKYREPVLPTEGPISRLSLNRALDRSRKLVYFNGPQPQGDNLSGHLFINVGINELSAEQTVSQQPVVHAALLLLGSLAVPGEIADALEDFQRTADPSSSEAVKKLQSSLDRIGERGQLLNRAFTGTGKTSDVAADELLESAVHRDAPADDSTEEEAAVRSLKYASPSIEALQQQSIEVRTRYLAEHAKSRGERALAIPGTAISLPGFLFLLGLPVLLLGGIAAKVWLTSQGYACSPPRDMSLRAAELKYGFLILRLLGVRAERGRGIAIGQTVFICSAPLALLVPVALARGPWTVWISLPLVALVIGAELWLVQRAFSSQRLSAWPVLDGHPPD